jgi:hypothetical protein
METDRPSEKRSPGRPRKANPHLVIETAKTFRTQFTYAWQTMGEQLLAAQSALEVWEIVKSGRGVISNTDFIFSERIFEIIHNPKFPKVRTKSRINFLADSLAGNGVVTPGRSREICAKERAKVRHVIVRRDFYIECTCAYRGPALNGACPECGTMDLSEELRRREEYEYL